jgi:hypothetical protein
MRRSLLSALAALSFCAAFLVVFQGRFDNPPRRERERSGAMEALEFWSRSRAYPSRDIPPDKYFAAFLASRSRFKGEPRRFAAASAGWQPIGPANLSGRMISVAVNPQNPSTVYAGSASGGLWRSHTGGTAGDWQRVNTGYPVLGVGAVAVSPSDSNVLYIGTGEVYRYQGAAGGLVLRTTRGSYGMGILKSTDGGTSWAKSLDWSYQQQRGVQSIKINPLNPATVWAATTDGIFKSTDAGGTWVESILLYMGEDIVIHATDTNSVLVSSGNFDLAAGIFKTTDGGGTWNQVNPVGFSGKALLDSPPTDPDLVVASIADSTTGDGALWMSTDFGSSWTPLTTSSIYGVQGWYSHYVAVNPANTSVLFHASVSAARSTNGGASFGGVSGLYSDNHDFAYDPTNPDILYSANDDGIYRSTNFGSSFTPVNGGLATGQLYNGFSSSQTDSVIALGQSQDHIPGYLYQGSASWASSAVDEAGWTAIDPTNDAVMYAINRFGGSIYQSSNRGLSFAFRASFGSAGAWNTPIAVAPSSPSTVYVAKTRFFRSTNGASNWSTMNGGLDIDGNPAIAIAVSETSPDTVYVGMAPFVTRAHLFLTTNGGSNWTDVTGGLPDRYPLDIAVDPKNSRTVYAAFGGYGTGHVFRSSNSGATWTDVSGTLPDIPATALLVDPLIPNTVYLGTDLGVYVSTDAGLSWSTLSDGLPDAVLISDLSLTRSNRTLRAVTHGNGVFERKLPPSIPAVFAVVPAGGEQWEVGTVHDISWDQVAVPSARLRYSTDNGLTWFPIADSAASPYAWTIPPVLTSAARVEVSSRTDTAVAAASAAPFTLFLNGSFVQFRAGWNLLSLPVAVANHSRTALFPAAAGSAFSYATSYVAADSLAEGLGYWLKSAAVGLATVAGEPIVGDTVAVHAGWNLVGALTSPFSAGDVASNPPGIVTSLYFGYDGSYAAADSLRPGSGYWVKCSAAGTLVRGTPAAAKAQPAGALQALAGMNTLTLTDAGGSRQRLYFASGTPGFPVSRYEAPPLPPAGAFDARFGSGTVAAYVGAPGARAVPVELSSARYPVTAAWTSSGAGTGASLRVGREDVPLSGNGSVRIESAETALALVPADEAASGRPAAYALRQNYPNPFNPATEISYDLPEDAHVRLTVYSLLGAEVARLVDGPAAAGSHAVRWNAEGMPSGVYLVRLDAGRMSATRKMLLMK